MIGRHRLMLLASIGVLACASASTATSAARCTLSSADSVFLKRGTVYRPCAVDRQAEAIARPQPDFQPDLSFGEACYSAEFEFVVDTAGAPEVDEARQLHANNPNFATAALAALRAWRYKPAVLHGVPVRQITTERFGLSAVRVTAPAGQTPRRPDRVPKC